MDILFRKPKVDTVSQSNVSSTEPDKKKVRGKPFAKGDDPRRHITGRSKLGATLAQRYRNALSEAESEAEGGEYTKLDAMIDILIGKALEGNLDALKYLQERGYGKVPDQLVLNPTDDDDQTKFDLTLLTLEEQAYWNYLMQKSLGEHPPSPYVLVASKDHQLSHVIDGEVMEQGE